MQLVGRLTSKYHIPVISPRDYVEGQEQQPGLTTPVEGRLPFKPDIYSLEILMKKSVFQNSDASFTLIQQRSPVVKVRIDTVLAWPVRGRFRLTMDVLQVSKG